MHLFEEIEGNMVPTKQWMQTKYNQFNQELFDGFLPPCRLMTKKLAPKHLGMYSTISANPNFPVTRENIYDVARPTIYLTTAYSAPPTSCTHYGTQHPTCQPILERNASYINEKDDKKKEGISHN